jgi:predicted transposase YbfD/YdcC
MQDNHTPEPAPPSLVECLGAIDDPRMDRTRRHKLVDVLAIGLCSMLTGGEGFNDMQMFGEIKRDWLKTFLELPHGIPTHDTFNRVFSAIDPHCFLDCFVRWVRSICPALEGDVVAIDGKALRHALDEGNPIPYIVSAWAAHNRLALGQVRVDDKSNEITAIPELLKVLYLKGCIVTIDAMGCQKDIAARIADKGADYVLALKGNHATVHEEVALFFADAVTPCADSAADCATPNTMAFCRTVEKDHGRLETRRYWQSTDIGWMQDKKLWKKLASFGMVESVRTVKGKSSIERRYYLTSLPLDVDAFANAVRAHWGVENPLHWCLDVIFHEDQSRARCKNAAQNLATLRRIALNLIKKNTRPKISQRQKRIFAALDPAFLEELLGF